MQKFLVEFDVSGRITVQVEAESYDKAVAAANEMAENEEFALELDEGNVDHFSVTEMHKVQRAGKILHTTYVWPGDYLLPSTK